MYRFSVRLRGIDSPEIKSKSLAEKELAMNSKMALSNLILGQIVELKNVSTEKYGRILADVYIDNVNVNTWMLENKLALPYDGGKKTRPPEWDNETNDHA
jgi:endonuclease YncB( thermonuclease family)